ncbi:MAG: TIGR01244 family sulfur transferase [Maritimibacter harenae]|jgi:sulfide:quinone oxidoreductase|uniref:TIGR01244 family phosphatase n=1 Tax=Maritimibacter harenae TaxID=2606218 RepID=A0A845M617_9RHOB|nr:TIGR01244 family sulfur transferase [Maritimibacter harenae]MZR13918.1 TIGR01244 family phosphatase [Maritimibacter harenae]
MQQLDQQVWVSPQIQPADVETIAAEGFKAIVCNRPDGEEPGQPDWASVEAAAKAAGLRTYYLPMASREVPADTADGFAKAMSETDGKVFAYCRSGARCTAIWNAAKARV